MNDEQTPVSEPASQGGHDESAHGEKQRTGSPWMGYALAIAIQLAIAGILYLLRPYVPLYKYPIFYILTVTGIAYWFGSGPTVAAFLLGFVAFSQYVFAPASEDYALLTKDLVAGTAAFLSGSLLGGITGLMVRQSRCNLHDAMNALRISSDRLQAVMDNTPAIVYLKDTEGRLLIASQGLAKLAGMTQEEAVGHTIQEIIKDRQSAETIESNDRRVLQAGKPLSMEELIDAGSGPRTFASLKFPLRNPEGKIYAVGGVSTDITDRVESEHALTDAQESLRRQMNVLQRALQPQDPPNIPGYTFASAYVPTSALQDVGGDFYDIFMTEGGRVGILIGDVPGRSSDSAALASNTRSTIRAFAYEFSSPCEALEHTNSILTINQIGGAQFVTAFLMVLDPATGSIEFSGAGHPPVMIRRADGNRETLESSTIPLGVVSGARFEEGAGHLGSGDKIILYTDGIVESGGSSNALGIEGIEKVIDDFGESGPNDLVTKMLDTARLTTVGGLEDDVALLVVQRNGSKSAE